MLNSAQNQVSSNTDKENGSASIFDRSEAVRGSQRVAGSETPTNDYKFSYQEFHAELASIKESLQAIADKYEIVDGIDLNISNSKARCYINASKVAIG